MADLYLPTAGGPAPTDRRGFFKRLGVGAAAAGLVASGCDSGPELGVVPGDRINLDFSNDFGPLNYAYLLERLEAEFYAQVVANAAFTTTFPDAGEQAVFQDLARHEAIHRDFLQAALGENALEAVTNATFEFPESSINFTNRTSVLRVAQTLEDLGVAAYNGAGRYIQDDGLLTLAGKIVSVEARHAATIATLSARTSIAPSGIINANGLDRALTPIAVLNQADVYLVNTFNVINA